MTERGFTLVELLIASLITLLGGRAPRCSWRAPPALRSPLSRRRMDTVRRLREGADALAAAIASAGGERGIGEDTEPLSAALPVVRLAGTAGTEFSELIVTRSVQGGRGRLASDQPGPGGSLTLETADGLCPRSGDVCGFAVGDVAVAFDGRGHSDVFIVAAVFEPLGAHLAAGTAHLRLSRRRVGGCGAPGTAAAGVPAGRRPDADAHDCRRGAGADSRRCHATAARRLGRGRRRPPSTHLRWRPASRRYGLVAASHRSRSIRRASSPTAAIAWPPTTAARWSARWRRARRGDDGVAPLAPADLDDGPVVPAR